MSKRLLNPDAEFLNIDEVGKLFSPPISRVSFWKWEKEGKLQLPSYQLGNKKYYKRSEVIREIERFKTKQDAFSNPK